MLLMYCGKYFCQYQTAQLCVLWITTIVLVKLSHYRPRNNVSGFVKSSFFSCFVCRFHPVDVLYLNATLYSVLYAIRYMFASYPVWSTHLVNSNH